MSRPTVFVMEAQAKAALPIIQSMAQRGVRVAAGSELAVNSGFYCRGCRERHVYPSPRTQSEAFKGWLLSFLSRRRIAMLFPVGHYGALAVAQVQEAVRRHTRLVMPDEPTFMRAYAKIRTMKAAVAAGVPIPESWFPEELPGGIDEAAEQIHRWPVLVKPSVGVGARGITWCHDVESLRRAYPGVRAAHGESYVQDFVPPGGMQYKVDMLVDDSQRLLGQIVYGKTRMYPPDGGSSVLNYSADRPDILALAHRMLKELKWVGFCDFDFVVDPRDNVAKLMEINPRFPESYRIGPSVGVDFAVMLYEMAHGRPVRPVLDYPKDHFLRFLPGDLLWYLRAGRERRRTTWPSWFLFWDRRTSYQLCSVKDWGPIMGYALENLRMVMDPRVRKERLRLEVGARGGGA